MLKLLGLKLLALPLEQELKLARLPSGDLQGPEVLPQALPLDLPDRRRMHDIL